MTLFVLVWVAAAGGGVVGWILREAYVPRRTCDPPTYIEPSVDTEPRRYVVH